MVVLELASMVVGTPDTQQQPSSDLGTKQGQYLKNELASGSAT